METKIMKKNQKKYWLVSVIIIFSLFCFTRNSLTIAKQKTERGHQELSSLKQVIGEVSSINSKYIGIIYQKDVVKGKDKEILLRLGDNIQIVHRRKLSEIKQGDRVKIVFEEKSKKVNKVKADGTEELVDKITGRKVKEITLIKSGS